MSIVTTNIHLKPDTEIRTKIHLEGTDVVVSLGGDAHLYLSYADAERLRHELHAALREVEEMDLQENAEADAYAGKYDETLANARMGCDDMRDDTYRRELPDDDEYYWRDRG